ncbi:hypothetical protein Tco_0937096 [Tanacetum coccineum]|uniref:Uncharacterized protein n=1 Tax=Tanacetum coccineum TaxID=301880 RepID=A0ABQ5DG33_9ASTR
MITQMWSNEELSSLKKNLKVVALRGGIYRLCLIHQLKRMLFGSCLINTRSLNWRHFIAANVSLYWLWRLHTSICLTEVKYPLHPEFGKLMLSKRSFWEIEKMRSAINS